MADETVFYFAYGSNTDQDRFRGRIGEWRARCTAHLADYRLRFAASVQSEGGGAAVVDEMDGGRVDGVLYELTPEQMATMDHEQLDAARNIAGARRRVSVTVSTDQGPRVAELYTVEDDGAWCAPSERYLEVILRGLKQSGHRRATVERLRQAALFAPRST
jgi:cation transport regulator ChaC